MADSRELLPDPEAGRALLDAMRITPDCLRPLPTGQPAKCDGGEMDEAAIDAEIDRLDGRDLDPTGIAHAIGVPIERVFQRLLATTVAKVGA